MMNTGFDDFANTNISTIEQEYMAQKATAKAKIPKPPPPPKQPRPNAAVIKETRKFLHDKEEDEAVPQKVAILRKIDLIRIHFGSKIGKKYPKLTIKNDIDEIAAQLEEMEGEISGANSIPLTKMAFVQMVSALKHLTTKIIPQPMGLRTENLTNTVSDPKIFREYFEEHLTLIAIKHDLFSTGPKASLLLNFAQVVTMVHMANICGKSMESPLPKEFANSDRYADL